MSEDWVQPRRRRLVPFDCFSAADEGRFQPLATNVTTQNAAPEVFRAVRSQARGKRRSLEILERPSISGVLIIGTSAPAPRPPPPRLRLTDNIGSAKPIGANYAFRCARENADGQVGPWSADLRCVVPADSGKSSGNRISDGRPGKRDACSGGGSSGAAVLPQPPPPPAATTPPALQPRFDLLVPALVEAFAGLIDAGDRRIRCAVTGNTCVVRSLSTPPPPPSPPPPAPPPAPPSEPPLAPPSAAAKKSKSFIKASEADESAHRLDDHRQKQGDLCWERERETREMVWEEHWDSQRRAQFFRLRGQKLSVWQVPDL